MDYRQLSSRFAGITVKTLEEKEIAIDSLWKNRRAVVAFLRHFG